MTPEIIKDDFHKIELHESESNQKKNTIHKKVRANKLI